MNSAVIVCAGFLIWRYMRRPRQAVLIPLQGVTMDDFGPVPTTVADNVIPALLHDLRQAEGEHDVDSCVSIKAELDRLLRQPLPYVPA